MSRYGTFAGVRLEEAPGSFAVLSGSDVTADHVAILINGSVDVLVARLSDTPSAAAVVGRPSGPGVGGLTGHHRRVGTHPGARGKEVATVREAAAGVWTLPSHLPR